MFTIEIQDTVQHPDTPNEAQLQTWAATAMQNLPEALPEHIENVCLRIVTLEESEYLNTTFRNKSGPTNVLSFHYTSVTDTPNPSLGDLAICAELVSQEAREQGIDTDAHWAHLLVHGILHLIGYDHINDADALIMENLEIDLLAKLNFPNPYKIKD